MQISIRAFLWRWMTSRPAVVMVTTATSIVILVLTQQLSVQRSRPSDLQHRVSFQHGGLVQNLSNNDTTTTNNKYNIYHNIKHEMAEAESEFLERLLHYEEGCQGHLLEKVTGEVYYHGPSHLSVCHVPKTGCTFWKQVFHFLYNETGGKSVRSPLEIDRYDVHLHLLPKKKVKVLHYDSWHGKEAQLIDDTKKVLFARDPYARVWSTYVDKFLLPEFWPHHGLAIVQRRKGGERKEEGERGRKGREGEITRARRGYEVEKIERKREEEVGRRGREEREGEIRMTGKEEERGRTGDEEEKKGRRRRGEETKKKRDKVARGRKGEENGEEEAKEEKEEEEEEEEEEEIGQRKNVKERKIGWKGEPEEEQEMAKRGRRKKREGEGERKGRERAFLCPDDISFEEYLTYVVTANLDPHWMPVHKVCNPCVFRPRYVGKMETFSRDAAYILKQSGLEALTKGLDQSHHVEEEVRMLTKYYFRLYERRDDLRACLTHSGLAVRLWQAFVFNGYIGENVTLPELSSELDGNGLDTAEAGERATRLLLQAHHLSSPALSPLTARSHRRRVMAQHYRALPASLLHKFLDVFQGDFALFGYESKTQDIFV